MYQLSSEAQFISLKSRNLILEYNLMLALRLLSLQAQPVI